VAAHQNYSHQKLLTNKDKEGAPRFPMGSHPRRGGGLCLVQAEDRPILRDTDSWSTNEASGSLGTMGFKKLLDTNRLLCEADANCTYVRHDSKYKDVQPHWRKVFIGSMVLNTTRCPVVAWLDSDSVLAGPPSDLLALLRPPASEHAGGAMVEQADDRRYVWPAGVRKLDSVKAGEIHMVGAGEGDMYHHNLSPFNAGVWMVANTRLGRAIMNQWVSVYAERAAAHWKRDLSGRHTGQDDLSWRCVQADESRRGSTTPCRFSGEHYEQGAFVRHVLSVPRFRHAIRLVPWQLLQGVQPHPMVHHFIGPPRTKSQHITQFMKYRPLPHRHGTAHD
jgi:hypothetical protein